MKSRPDDAGPNDPVPGPSPLAERVLRLLEDACVTQPVGDEIVKAIETLETQRGALLAACDLAQQCCEHAAGQRKRGWDQEYVRRFIADAIALARKESS